MDSAIVSSPALRRPVGQAFLRPSEITQHIREGLTRSRGTSSPTQGLRIIDLERAVYRREVQALLPSHLRFNAEIITGELYMMVKGGGLDQPELAFKVNEPYVSEAVRLALAEAFLQRGEEFTAAGEYLRTSSPLNPPPSFNGMTIKQLIAVALTPNSCEE